jgi:hypothetical protein
MTRHPVERAFRICGALSTGVKRRDAELLALQIYTLGGTGVDAAPAPNWEKCPVALPRCP